MPINSQPEPRPLDPATGTKCTIHFPIEPIDGRPQFEFIRGRLLGVGLRTHASGHQSWSCLVAAEDDQIYDVDHHELTMGWTKDMGHACPPSPKPHPVYDVPARYRRADTTP